MGSLKASKADKLKKIVYGKTLYKIRYWPSQADRLYQWRTHKNIEKK